MRLLAALGATEGALASASDGAGGDGATVAPRRLGLVGRHAAEVGLDLHDHETRTLLRPGGALRLVVVVLPALLGHALTPSSRIRIDKYYSTILFKNKCLFIFSETEGYF